MAFDTFLKIDGIQGDSQVKGHVGEIEILELSWGETAVPGPSKGAGVGALQVQTQDFHFLMATSKASPALMTNCTRSTTFQSATLSCRRPGDRQEDFIVIKMSRVMITEYSLAGSNGDDNPMDDVSLTFDKIDFQWIDQPPTA